MIKVGILGATAYTSLELIKILLRHTGVEIAYLGIRRDEKPAISEIFPALEGRIDLKCKGIEPEDVPGDVKLIFATLPPTIAMRYIPGIVKLGVRVVDLSADYRFKEKDVYEKWYKAEHVDPDGIKTAVYGLPELFNNEIKNAQIIGNPGCYPTGTILGLAPLLKNGLIYSDDIIVDAKSGISGAGREPTDTTHYCERNENIEAYKVGCHRHTPEINHILSRVAGTDISIFFTPHLTPMSRGILNTTYAKIKDGVSHNDIQNVYDEAYQDKTFARVKTKGKLPRVLDVANSNYCDISFNIVDNRVIIVSCIDNLIKGAAGQAVQNMNIMLGLDETMGLL